jgi:hypothetical protein
MRRLLVTALLAVGLGLTASLTAPGRVDDPPAPILKPVSPAGGQVRVRYPLAGGDKKVLQFSTKALVAPGKARMEDTPVEITISLGTSGRNMATDKMLRSWGYDVPAGAKVVVLPELTLTGTQIAPKAAKGSDVAVRLTSVRVEVKDADAVRSDKMYGTDLYMVLHEIVRGADRAMEPRLNFAERCLDLNFPPASVKRPGTGDDPPPDPPSKADPKLTVFAAPITARPNAVFTHVTINGMDTLKFPNGPVPLQVILSSAQYFQEGFLLAIGAARLLGVDVDTSKGQISEARVKELRLGVQVGAGYKTAKDFVLTDVPVLVDTFDSGPIVSIGPNFINKHFPDAVYAADRTGTHRLYGRVNPETLGEPKTRGKKP